MVASLYQTYARQGFEMVEKCSRLFSSTFLKEKVVKSQTLPQLVRGLLPAFDVPANLRLNKGAQLFTIGIPDKDGFGGDALVPAEHRDAIVAAINDSEQGTYVPMLGAEHITDVWKLPTEQNEVRSFLRRNNIAPRPYLDGSSSTSGQFVHQAFEELKQKLSITENDHPVLNVLRDSSENASFEEIEGKIDALCAQTGQEHRQLIIKSALEIAKEFGHKVLATFLAGRLIGSI
jgi:hypothetical protein